MKKETKRNVIENSDSKNHDSVKLHSELTNELSNNVKSSKLLCYVCASSNPQFQGSLFDGRKVNYCGDCFSAVQGFKENKK